MQKRKLGQSCASKNFFSFYCFLEISRNTKLVVVVRDNNNMLPFLFPEKF